MITIEEKINYILEDLCGEYTLKGSGTVSYSKVSLDKAKDRLMQVFNEESIECNLPTEKHILGVVAKQMQEAIENFSFKTASMAIKLAKKEIKNAK